MHDGTVPPGNRGIGYRALVAPPTAKLGKTMLAMEIEHGAGKKPEMVNHPKHYNNSPARCAKCDASIECIQVIRHMKCNIANAIKYLWRCEDKNNAIEDMRKAVWYINDEIEERSRAKAKQNFVAQCQERLDRVRVPADKSWKKWLKKTTHLRRRLARKKSR